MSPDLVIKKNEVITVILGGGRGSRLMPLTGKRSKPAVGFGGKYRIIDIPISNALNSGFEQIFVLTQFHSYSLNRHIARTYGGSNNNKKQFVEIIAAEQTNSSLNWFEGTADAVRKVLPYIQEYKPKLVMILSGDQLYHMDLTEFVQKHLSSPGNEITVACNSIPENRVYGLGIAKPTQDGFIEKFIEKPNDITQVEDCRLEDGKFLANMGIYIFNTETLAQALEDSTLKDFGKEIIPKAVQSKKVQFYDYKGYWEDIGTIRSFYDANLMLTDPLPPFNLYLESSPFYSRARSLPPSKINNAKVSFALLSEGCILNECEIHRSIIGIRQVVEKNTIIHESVVMGADGYGIFDRKGGTIPIGIGSDCTIKGAIIDKDCAIGNGVKLVNKNGYEEYQDEYVSIREGVIVVPRRSVIPDGYEI
jgi:glucose-1-phosphate adenylyltransferase